MPVNTTPNKSYAHFGLYQSYRQMLHALRARGSMEKNTRDLLAWVREQEAQMERAWGGPIRGLRILEIGPGQEMQRARYFGLHNTVIGMDLDVIKDRYSLRDYLDMWKKNGLGRVLKTIGRRLILRGPNDRAWANLLGVARLPPPQMIYGDICAGVPEQHAFDFVMSWSVFEHLPDPRAALQNILQSLRPGGAFFISIHLYTSINGHHDIRGFTGMLEALPLWGHLRPETRHLIQPSAYLNEWRLDDWRRLFAELAPGYQEILECGDIPERFGAQLTGELARDLSGYRQEELLNVNALYLWKQPPAGQ